MEGLRKRHQLLAALFGLGLCCPCPVVLAAENVVFVSGAFRRSIPVADFEHLALTGEAKGLLADVLKFSHQQPEAMAKLLNQSVALPVVLVSRLLNTRIGEALLSRLAQIIFPLNSSQVSLPALRSAVILGLSDNKKGLSAVSFLKAYPTQELAVSLPGLMSLASKASSIADLVRFFSESPLDGLQGDKNSNSKVP